MVSVIAVSFGSVLKRLARARFRRDEGRPKERRLLSLSTHARTIRNGRCPKKQAKAGARPARLLERAEAAPCRVMDAALVHELRLAFAGCRCATAGSCTPRRHGSHLDRLLARRDRKPA